MQSFRHDGRQTDPDRWQQIEALFHAVLEVAPHERNSFLAERCKDDTAIRRDVERLLRYGETRTPFLEQSPLQSVVTGLARTLVGDGDDPLASPGVTIGRCRLIERIAHGGMGNVWKAHRIDGAFDQCVAIKLIKRGMDTDDILRRFRNERQLLASFEHPNIARLLDGGSTEDGRPFLVMEYIDGAPIDQYCDDHALGVRQRLELFMRVCTAIHEAHKNLIVHRDLKPSNILVSDTGDPKLLDFGIAKVLDPDSANAASVTVTGLRMLTPRYASPEQVRGDTITTASDVYSIGVILYELLTGCRPYELETESRQELERMVLEHEPTRPSLAVTRPSNLVSGTTIFSPPEVNSRKLRRTLAGDLDTIIMTALRKEPQRRYGSAEELASDIERYLRDAPIDARPDTWFYRSSKFVRRNRGAVVMAVATVLIIIAGAVVASIG